jgi:hypothetical protein
MAEPFLKSLAGVPSSGGGGNATVSGGAPIQPAQAFVDAMLQFRGTLASGNWGKIIDFSNAAATSVTGALSDFDFASMGAPAGYFQGNALPVAQVNAILAKWAAQAGNAADQAVLDSEHQLTMGLAAISND